MPNQPDAPRIVGVGGVFIDDIVLPSGQTYMGQLGGGVVHALMGAALWGERPGICATVGQGLPPAAYGHLSTHLDTQGLHTLDLPQIRAWQLFEEDGTRRELYRVRETVPFIRGAQPEHLPDIYRDCQGYYLLQGFEGVRAWRKILRGFILWEPLQQIMTPENRPIMQDVLRECDIDLVSPNLVEAQAVYGNLPPEELIAMMLADGAQAVALRMGGKGSIVANREEQHYIPAVPVSRIVDQTGAGNTYCGGLLWGITSGKNWFEAGAAGAIAASFCLEGVGVLNPTQIDLAERNQRYQKLLNNG
ncbi:MAG: hypothetical protein K8L97_06290 [Anaerolineae bacterium]|nr:hypothetical protein [Anaerolineae bacterium]